MLKNAIPVAIFLGLCGLVWAGRKAYTGSRLSIRIVGIKLNPLSKAAIIVDVINPTGVSLDLDAFVANLFYNGIDIATVDFRNRTTLTAAGLKRIEIPIRISPIGGIQLASEIVQKGINAFKNFKFDVKGTISSQGLSIPFSQSFGV